MREGTTCYERDEVLCDDQMCLRVGCRLRNERLTNDWCPLCRNIAVPYPDGRMTCLRCEWEEPR
jgi:hypothetical protein